MRVLQRAAHQVASDELALDRPCVVRAEAAREPRPRRIVVRHRVREHRLGPTQQIESALAGLRQRRTRPAQLDREDLALGLRRMLQLLGDVALHERDARSRAEGLRRLVDVDA